MLHKHVSNSVASSVCRAWYKIYVADFGPFLSEAPPKHNFTMVAAAVAAKIESANTRPMQYPVPPLHREYSSDAHRCVDHVITPNIGSDRAFCFLHTSTMVIGGSRPPILHEVHHAKWECSYLGEFSGLEHDPHIRMTVMSTLDLLVQSVRSDIS